MVKTIIRLEGLAFFVTAIWLYGQFGFNWPLFAVLLLVPDISMIGYLKDTKLGSITYNLVHNFALALALFLLGVMTDAVLLKGVGLILMAHVGMDRFFGFGLKYPIGFKHTHLQKV